MKKIIQGVFALSLIALLFLSSPAPAQDQKGVELDNAQEYRLVTAPPPFGSYYSLTLLLPPFPFNPFPDLPVFELGKGMFVYDDRKVDYVALRAFQAAAASAAFVPGGGGGMAMMSGGPLPPYDVPGLKLTIPAFTNGYIYTTIFEHDPWLAYDIYSRTNLNSTNWLFGTWGVVGQTNYYLLQSGFPQNVFLIAASGMDGHGCKKSTVEIQTTRLDSHLRLKFFQIYEERLRRLFMESQRMLATPVESVYPPNSPARGGCGWRSSRARWFLLPRFSANCGCSGPRVPPIALESFLARFVHAAHLPRRFSTAQFLGMFSAPVILKKTRSLTETIWYGVFLSFAEFIQGGGTLVE